MFRGELGSSFSEMTKGIHSDSSLALALLVSEKMKIKAIKKNRIFFTITLKL
jgi:hypothetical protein